MPTIRVDSPGALTTGGPGTRLGINPEGKIMGGYKSADGNFHGFLRSKGEFTTIDFPGDIRTEANRITAEDDVVGTHADGSATLHGFRLSEGSFTSIDFRGPTFTRGLGINSEG
jgi:hypothetical protein